MEKKEYTAPRMLIRKLNLERLLADISGTEVGDDFVEGAKEDFGDLDYPHSSSVWDD